MKTATHKMAFLVLLGSLSLFGTACGRDGETQQALRSNNTPIKGASCNVNGRNYSSGQAVPSPDSCNSCGCRDGQVMCTLMACS